MTGKAPCGVLLVGLNAELKSANSSDFALGTESAKAEAKSPKSAVV